MTPKLSSFNEAQIGHMQFKRDRGFHEVEAALYLILRAHFEAHETLHVECTDLCSYQRPDVLPKFSESFLNTFQCPNMFP